MNSVRTFAFALLLLEATMLVPQAGAENACQILNESGISGVLSKFFLGRDLHARRIAGLIPMQASTAAQHDLSQILDRLPRDSSRMSQDQSQRAVKELIALASKHGIVVEAGVGGPGVYPQGLYKVVTSGLQKDAVSAKSVGVIELHELAHLYHVLLARITLINAVKGAPPSQLITVEQAEQYLDYLEGGPRYRAFENMVTATASPLHLLFPAKITSEEYVHRVTQILSATQRGIHSADLVPYKESHMVDLYAAFISRAPIVLGKSVWGTLARMPFIFFVIYYLLDPDIPSGSGGPVRDENGNIPTSFRQLVHALFDMSKV